ncbi:SNF2-related domain-containing protein [Tieghemostelium lacteum]|uniref:SNF2-related domain-containing protein n=1 Tax=Tieghemostelium lacteum TaxID=361077 RepID=A0A151Z7Z5_TIELA|nr:SNF2-related domain-containing protein [Tieghemostelium lacteum]|eukprot:KYQ90093.1 SNF2-related domain-containing protein [Tieghemostelium lacteum]
MNYPTVSNTENSSSSQSILSSIKIKCPIHNTYCRKVTGPTVGKNKGKFSIICRENNCSFKNWYSEEELISIHQKQIQNGLSSQSSQILSTKTPIRTSTISSTPSYTQDQQTPQQSQIIPPVHFEDEVLIPSLTSSLSSSGVVDSQKNQEPTQQPQPSQIFTPTPPNFDNSNNKSTNTIPTKSGHSKILDIHLNMLKENSATQVVQRQSLKQKLFSSHKPQQVQTPTKQDVPVRNEKEQKQKEEQQKLPKKNESQEEDQEKNVNSFEDIDIFNSDILEEIEDSQVSDIPKKPTSKLKHFINSNSNNKEKKKSIFESDEEMEPMEKVIEQAKKENEEKDRIKKEKKEQLLHLQQHLQKQQTPNSSHIKKTNSDSIQLKLKKKDIKPCIPISDSNNSQNVNNNISNTNNNKSPRKTRLPFDPLSDDITDLTTPIQNGNGVNVNKNAFTPTKIKMMAQLQESRDINTKIKCKKTEGGEVVIDFQLIGVNTVGTTYPLPLEKETEHFIKEFIKFNGKHNGEDETWSFLRSDYYSLCKRLKELQQQNSQSFHASVRLIPKLIFEYVNDPWNQFNNHPSQKKSNNNKNAISTSKPTTSVNINKESNENIELDITRIPKTLFEALLPFQIKGLIFGIEKKGRCLIGDEMGLGKTIQALAITHYFKEQWPLLIVCPSSLRDNWAREIKKWFGMWSSLDVNVMLTGQHKADAVINIISYDLVSSLLEKELLPQNFKSIICDESHYLKSVSAQRTSSVLKLIQKATVRILLTGTPALSRPIELYSQLVALGAPVYSSPHDFAMRYCNAFKGRYGWDYTGNNHLPELNTLLRGVMIRRHKDDVLKDLPKKHRYKVVIDTDTSDQSSQDIETGLNSIFTKPSSIWQQKKQQGQSLDNEKSQIMSMYQETGRQKLKASCKYILQQIQDQKKFLVFAHHSDILNGLEDFIKTHGTQYIRIDGSTPASQRQDLVNIFQTKKTCQVALLSITAAGTGLTLTASNLVIFVELYWTPGVLRQAEDRVHRIGQTREVNIEYLVAKKTLDDKIWPVICNKLEVLGETLDGQEEILHTKNRDLRGAMGMNSMDRYINRGGNGAINIDDDSSEKIFTIIGDDPEISRFIDQCNKPDDEEDDDSNKKKRKKSTNISDNNNNDNNISKKLYRNPSNPKNNYVANNNNNNSKNNSTNNNSKIPTKVGPKQTTISSFFSKFTKDVNTVNNNTSNDKILIDDIEDDDDEFQSPSKKLK